MDNKLEKGAADSSIDNLLLLIVVPGEPHYLILIVCFQFYDPHPFLSFLSS